jgi:hypothetical protein
MKKILIAIIVFVCSLALPVSVGAVWLSSDDVVANSWTDGENIFQATKVGGTILFKGKNTYDDAVYSFAMVPAGNSYSVVRKVVRGTKDALPLIHIADAIPVTASLKILNGKNCIVMYDSKGAPCYLLKVGSDLDAIIEQSYRNYAWSGHYVDDKGRRYYFNPDKFLVKGFHGTSGEAPYEIMCEKSRPLNVITLASGETVMLVNHYERLELRRTHYEDDLWLDDGPLVTLRRCGDPDGSIVVDASHPFISSVALTYGELKIATCQHHDDAYYFMNEILARHGVVFKDAELKRFFSGQDWYMPRPKANERLSEIERINYSMLNLMLEQDGTE